MNSKIILSNDLNFMMINDDSVGMLLNHILFSYFNNTSDKIKDFCNINKNIKNTFISMTVIILIKLSS